MSKLIPPHGGKGLTCCLLEGAELDAEKKKAKGLKKITVSHREVGDLIMMGIGGFSPLTGFMTKADWKVFVKIISWPMELSGPFP